MSDSDNNRDSIVSMATIAGNPIIDNLDGKVKGTERKATFLKDLRWSHLMWKWNLFSAVDILLNATGNVPIMKKRKWTVDQEKQLSWVIRFIHKYLKLDPEDKLVHLSLYIDRLFHYY